MIKLVVINSAKAAQVFADYCQTQGWAVSIVALPAAVAGQTVAGRQNQAEIYVDPGDVQEVSQALQQFLDEPEHRRYQAAAWQLNTPQTTGETTEFGSLWLRLRQMTGPVTQLLAVASVMIYLLLDIWPQPIFAALVFAPQLDTLSDLLSWRWFSPALLHFSTEHLMFNLLALWIFGGRLERCLGSQQLIILVLFTALVSHLAQFLLQGPNFGGLSGVVYGIFGFSWIYGWRHPLQELRLSMVDLVLVLVFLALGFADLLWVNTANWAHLGGLLAGMLLATISRRR